MHVTITYVSLARVYYSQRRFQEAENLVVQVIETKTRVLGDKQEEMLASMSNLAITYVLQGRLEEGEKLLLRVIEISNRAFGQENEHSLGCMGILGNVYRLQRRWGNRKNC